MVNSNAKNLLRQLLSSGGTVGLLAAKDVGGNVRYIADYDAYPAVVEDTFTLTAANAGISVGSGSTAATEIDYQLGTTITSGLTGTVTTEKSVDASGNSSVTFTVTLTNTSGSSISISEIGYKQEIAASDSFKGTSATDRVFLLDRSVFDTITIAAGASAVIDYTIKAVVTNNGGAEGTKTITTNGVYNALDDSLDGYATVTVNVSPNVGSKNISTNGTYNASSDSLDGYSSVTVAVSPNVGTKSITENGTYNASSDSYDGYSSVTVAVPGSAVLGTKSITQNGTYNASSDNYDGYSQVTVDVSGGGGGSILLYTIATKSTGGQDASVTVNKYINNILQTSTDYLYTDAQTPVNIDGYIELDYGVTQSLGWTYTLLSASLLNNPIGFSRSWGYSVSESYGENFLIGGKGITQINPFPEGASTITLYNSNGITTTSSSIDANGTGTLSFSEQQAGYEGFVIELNVTPDKIYLVKFDYQNVDCQYWENPAYRLGWTLENSAKMNYQDWTQWPENIQRIPTVQHFKASIVPIGTKIYLNFNVCGYSDSRANTAEITNLKVYEFGESVNGNWDTIKYLTFARSGIEGGN